MIANTINGFHSMEITCEKRKQNTCYQNKPFVIFSIEVLCYGNPPLMLLVKLIIQRLFFLFLSRNTEFFLFLPHQNIHLNNNKKQKTKKTKQNILCRR